MDIVEVAHFIELDCTAVLAKIETGLPAVDYPVISDFIVVIEQPHAHGAVVIVTAWGVINHHQVVDIIPETSAYVPYT